MKVSRMAEKVGQSDRSCNIVQIDATLRLQRRPIDYKALRTGVGGEQNLTRLAHPDAAHPTRRGEPTPNTLSVCTD